MRFTILADSKRRRGGNIPISRNGLRILIDERRHDNAPDVHRNAETDAI